MLVFRVAGARDVPIMCKIGTAIFLGFLILALRSMHRCFLCPIMTFALGRSRQDVIDDEETMLVMRPIVENVCQGCGCSDGCLLRTNLHVDTWLLSVLCARFGESQGCRLQVASMNHYGWLRLKASRV